MSKTSPSAGLSVQLTKGQCCPLDYTYDTTGSDNNGNVRTQAISLPGALFTQTYSYDQVNRLSSAQERIPTKVMWIQTYGYDRRQSDERSNDGFKRNDL